MSLTPNILSGKLVIIYRILGMIWFQFYVLIHTSVILFVIFKRYLYLSSHTDRKGLCEYMTTHWELSPPKLIVSLIESGEKFVNFKTKKLEEAFTTGLIDLASTTGLCSEISVRYLLRNMFREINHTSRFLCHIMSITLLFQYQMSTHWLFRMSYNSNCFTTFQ